MTVAAPHERFAAALAECNRANDALLAGQSAALKACFSHSEEATLFGGFGGHERGWSAIEPRLDWVAQSFASGRCDYELLASGAGDAIAFCVQFERIEAQLTNTPRPVRMDLRVTMVFRWQGGAWRLLHRHADHLMEKAPPTAAGQ
ncbi:MAG: YybH family protein [Candidatus Binatia bacterium]